MIGYSLECTIKMQQLLHAKEKGTILDIHLTFVMVSFVFWLSSHTKQAVCVSHACHCPR